MGRGRKARKRRQRKKRARARRRIESRALAVVPAGAGVAGSVVTRFELRVGELELARGHDGFLRGMPEPVMLIGLYCIDDAGARVVGRYLYRFARPGGFPDKVAPIERSNEQAPAVHARPASFVIMALAIEEDSGRGVQSLFAGLAHTDSLVAWAEDSDTPTPLHLDELAHGWVPVAGGRRVHLMLDGTDPAQSLVGDDWIGARMLITDDGKRRRQRHRLHFVSADGRNDWTAEIEIALRRD